MNFAGFVKGLKALWTRAKGVSRPWKIVWGVLVAAITLTGLTVPTVWRSYKAKKQEERKFRVLMPLLGTNQEYLEFIEGDGHYTGSYSAKVSNDVRQASEAAEKYWYDQMKGEKRTASVSFYAFPEGYDAKTYHKAFEKAVKTAEADGVEIAGVLGHITSSATVAYGDFYGGRNLPMILPLATATDLPNYLTSSCNVPAVLRLPPTNAKQAELISIFLLGNHAFLSLVVKDLSNPAYSNDLVQTFRNKYVVTPFADKHKRDRRPSPRDLFTFDEYGRILGVIPTGGESGEPFMRPALASKRVDALLLFGMTEFSVETLTQAWASGLEARYTILTDGAVDEYLLPRLNGLASSAFLEHADQKACAPNSVSPKARIVACPRTLYLSHPLEERLPARLEQIFAYLSDDQRYSLEMTHAQYVVDATLFFLDILHDTIVKDEREEKANVLVAETLKRWSNDKKTPNARYDKTWTYALDKSGSSTNKDYHLFRATLSGKGEQEDVVLVQADWRHADECPVTHNLGGAQR